MRVVYPHARGFLAAGLLIQYDHEAEKGYGRKYKEPPDLSVHFL
jgi:hypothetical protein